jgi:two-component system sensor histidine kinase CreC
MSTLLASREAVLLFGGVALLVGLAFVASRVLRSLRHGFSVRLQLFFAILGTSLMATGVIGLWVIERLQARAAELALEYGAPSEALVQLIREFGPKLTLLFALLGAGAAGAAFALGRSLAQPLERLTQYAESIARGERHAVLPPPVGREVRHELKNPVSAIRAATEVLQEGAADDPDARPRFLARIDEAGRRLEALLADLLELARLEARGPQPERGALALDDVIRRAVRDCAAAVEDKGLTVDTDLQPCRLHGDARWLRRAVDNLLSNAIRYSPAGGTVRVVLRAAEHEAVLTVRDEGPGVPAPIRPRLFQRFVTDRRESGQTGLGLAIVRSVAELHGGSARLVEDEGPGACIEVRVAR